MYLIFSPTRLNNCWFKIHHIFSAEYPRSFFFRQTYNSLRSDIQSIPIYGPVHEYTSQYGPLCTSDMGQWCTSQYGPVCTSDMGQWCTSQYGLVHEISVLFIISVNNEGSGLTVQNAQLSDFVNFLPLYATSLLNYNPIARADAVVSLWRHVPDEKYLMSTVAMSV